LIARRAGRAGTALAAMRFRPPRLIAMVLADPAKIAARTFLPGPRARLVWTRMAKSAAGL